MDDLVFLTEVPLPVDDSAFAQDHTIIFPRKFLVYPRL